MSQGYVRFPTLFQHQVVFISEDDLWSVTDTGGRAERLTAGVGEVSHPRFSPNGEFLAFVGHEEGPAEIYVMPSTGGLANRLTFLGANSRVVGWTPDGREILFSSNAEQFTPRASALFAVHPDTKKVRQLPLGLANAISYGPTGGVVLGRNINEPARWKRYRGGTVGHLWCDPQGDATFQRLLNLDGNLANPCWVGERIYFLSDHEGIGNIYSCTPAGEDLLRHSNQQDFYARNLSSDGRRLVFHAGADLFLFDPQTTEIQPLPVELPSLRTQRNRKFVNAGQFLDTYALHPQGYSVAITSRGKAFSMGNWEGSVLQHGEQDEARYRFLNWLNDKKRMIAISDTIGREALVLLNPEDGSESTFDEIEFGRVVDFKVSPIHDYVALTNHRNELITVDLTTREARVIERSEFDRINGLDWSPDGRWLAYGFAYTAQKTAIKLANMETGETHFASSPILSDVSPAFDPEGKYLYFLGYRTFNPVSDNMHFELGFPKAVRPYAITLRKDLRSPFIPEPKIPGETREKDKDDKKAVRMVVAEVEGDEVEEPGKENSNGNGKDDQDESKKANPITIDLDGITERTLAFPVPEARYSIIKGIKGKALFLSFPVEGSLHTPGESFEPKGTLTSYDFDTYKQETLVDGVNHFDISRTYKTLIYRTRHRLRVFKAGDKAPKAEGSERSGRETGWLDLGRIKVSILPAAEWRQMFAEAWRLQQEQFWSADMSGINWQKVYDQYAPLVDRVSSRSELSDLLWELQGELGTSHAYEIGGEYRQGPQYRQGHLGVDWEYNQDNERYRINHILKGDLWTSHLTSPLNLPGLNVGIGDAVIAINGQRVSAQRSPQELLVNQANTEVQLTLERQENQERYTVTVKTLTSEYGARYRDWVETNRQLVHERSGGKVGYIHIPDMGPSGYAEFHRNFLAEYDYQALLVDVRWNGGGNVSGLLLEKLARRRLGYDFSRWSQPYPYPIESPQGPMVALTNEQAGSDGDIFSHSFKLMNLGPLIGKRTWGGVVGIHPRHRLVDGTQTTQPEFAFWFKDVGWNVENYGTDPDIEVDIAPQDYAAGLDPQIDRAISEALRLIEEVPALKPDPGERPRLGR